MIIFPAIDIYESQAVRLYQGDYAQMTVYSDDPAGTAKEFKNKGASHIHIVDLEGARDGGTPNFETVKKIKEESGAFCEVGGGIRTMEVVEKYLEAGLDRVILGTAAVTDTEFLKEAVEKYGEKVAVGVDLKDGYAAIKGWTESTDLKYDVFFEKLNELGVRTVIVTDISKDGAMKGTDPAFYSSLSQIFKGDIIASGGISSLKDVVVLRAAGLYGAIIGKAYYTGALDLKRAIEVSE